MEEDGDRCWRPLLFSAPLVVLSLALSTAAPASRQAVPSAPPAAVAVAFAQVSIRESAADEGRASVHMMPSGDFTAEHITVLLLIARSFGVRAALIADVPDWVRDAHFDISARAPDIASVLDGQEMERRMLADRFGLVVRHEPRRVDAYALERIGRRLGPRIREASSRCTPMSWQPPEPPQATTYNECPTSWGWSSTGISIRQSPLSEFVKLLEREVGRPILDKTGLNAKYDADLRTPSGGELPPPGGSGADAFAAGLRDELGLKLTPAKTDVPALTIVAVHRPTLD